MQGAEFRVGGHIVGDVSRAVFIHDVESRAERCLCLLEPFRVLGLGSRISCLVMRRDYLLARFTSWVLGLGSRVSGLVSDLGSQVSDLGVRVSGFGFRISGLESRVSNLGSGISGLGFQVSGFGFRIQGLGFEIMVQGLRLRVEGRPLREVVHDVLEGRFVQLRRDILAWFRV